MDPSRAQYNRKRPAGGGGALLGLLQGGEDCEALEQKPDLACCCGAESDCVRLLPVVWGWDWRITGASRSAYPSMTCCRLVDRVLVQRARLSNRIDALDERDHLLHKEVTLVEGAKGIAN